MKSNTLTPRQQQVLKTIERLIQQHDRPPTRGEVAQAMGFRSVNAAVDHLRALARKGYVDIQPNVARGIRLAHASSNNAESSEPHSQALFLPLVGQVAAGQPILAQENIEQQHHLDAGLFHPSPDYLLRVRGESMRDAGILNGDLVAVHRTPEARNRQIVVARLDEDVTVKRYQRDGYQVQLIAENPDFAPISVDLREQPLAIEGLVVGVIRQQVPS
jgi:repressor LexA